MLRYGLAVALIPDHEMQFLESLPEPAALKDVDAVIVDAAMLRRGENPVSVNLKAAATWHVPMVWIDDLEPSLLAQGVNRVTLKPPVQREQLLKALFDCLHPATGSLPAVRKLESRAALPAKMRNKKAKEPTTTAADSTNVIELIEVVVDEPENG